MGVPTVIKDCHRIQHLVGPRTHNARDLRCIEAIDHGKNEMSLLDEDDLMTLCSKFKQFQSKLLRKWVQGLADEKRAAADMHDAPAADKHSNSPPSEDEGEVEDDEEENGDKDEDDDEDEDSDVEDEARSALGRDTRSGQGALARRHTDGPLWAALLKTTDDGYVRGVAPTHLLLRILLELVLGDCSARTQFSL
jgi:hypothetical protein